MRPGCHHDHLGRHVRLVVDRPVRRQDRPDQELLRQRGDLQQGRLDRVHLGQRIRCPADRSSASASSPDWVAACQVHPAEHPASEAGHRPAGGCPQCERHRGWGAADATGPCPVKVRTDCCRVAAYRVGVHLVRQEVRQLNRAAGAAAQSAARRSERPAQPDQEPWARPGAELLSVAAPIAGELGGPLA
jgi:hypothetical protein